MDADEDETCAGMHNPRSLLLFRLGLAVCVWVSEDIPCSRHLSLLTGVVC